MRLARLIIISKKEVEMKKIFYLPISIFLFGLMTLLIPDFTPQLPIWLGYVGILIVLFGQLFFPWQMWGLMITAYFLTGIIYGYTSYEDWERFNWPWYYWFLYAIGWPIIIAINKILKILDRRE